MIFFWACLEITMYQKYDLCVNGDAQVDKGIALVRHLLFYFYDKAN